MRISKIKRKIAILKEAGTKAEEREKLEIELKGLQQKQKSRTFQKKHGKKIALVKTGAGILARVGRGFGRMGKGVLKKARESEGLKRQYEQMYGPEPKPRRRIAIVKKKKR